MLNTEDHRIDCFCFGENYKLFSWENIPGGALMHGTVCHFTKNPAPPQRIQSCQSSHLRSWRGCQKKTTTVVAYPKIPSQAVSERLLCVRLYVFSKSCQHDVIWIHVDVYKDHLRSKAHVKHCAAHTLQ